MENYVELVGWGGAVAHLVGWGHLLLPDSKHVPRGYPLSECGSLR